MGLRESGPTETAREKEFDSMIVCDKTRVRVRRRLLSLTLAAALMAGMVPAALAAGPEGDTGGSPQIQAVPQPYADSGVPQTPVTPANTNIDLRSDVLTFQSPATLSSIGMYQQATVSTMRSVDLLPLPAAPTSSKSLTVSGIPTDGGYTVYCNGATATSTAGSSTVTFNVDYYAGQTNYVVAYKAGASTWAYAQLGASNTSVGLSKYTKTTGNLRPVTGTVTLNTAPGDGVTVLDFGGMEAATADASGVYNYTAPMRVNYDYKPVFFLKDGYYTQFINGNVADVGVLNSGNGYKYQFSTSNRMLSVTGTAEVADAGADISDPAHWKTPKLSVTDSGSYTRYNTLENATGANSNNPIFANVTSAYTEDRINNSTGDPLPDGKPDVWGVIGPARGNSNLELEARVYLTLNTVTGTVDMVRMTIAATNKSADTAQVYGLAWGVDLWSGTSDAATFQGQGIKEFSTGDVAPQFPMNYGPANATNAMTFNKAAYGSRVLSDPASTAYDEALPGYLYGKDPYTNFVSTIYPQIGSDIYYPGERFEKADYWGMSSYSNPAGQYGHTSRGDYTSVDSGFQVRHDPKLILPGETRFYGFDYGQGVVGQAYTGRPYLQVNMAATDLTANAANVAYDNQVTMDALYANDTQTAFPGAYLTLELDSQYLEPDASMTTASGAHWVLDSTDPSGIQTWKLDIGTLEVDAAGRSVIPPVALEGKPVYADVDPSDGFDGAKTDITLRLHVPGYAPYDADPELGYLKDVQTVTLPKLTALGLNGKVWRDINGNGVMDAAEGVRGQTVHIGTTNGVAADSAQSVGGGVVIGPTPSGGLQDNTDYYVWLDETAANGYVGQFDSVNVTDITGTTTAVILGAAQPSSSPLEVAEVVDGAFHFKLKPGAAALIDYTIQMVRQAIVKLEPHVSGSTATVYGGSATLSYSGTTLAVGTNPGETMQAAVPAGANVTVTYNVPDGYRGLSGEAVLTATRSNVAAYQPGSVVNTIDLPLLAGDVRLTGITGGGATENSSGPANEVTVPSAWSGRTARLDFKAWDVSGEITSPVRTNYTWSVADNTDGILTGGVDAQGSVTFQTGVYGSAVVKVALTAHPQISHTMTITIDAPSVGPVVGGIYLARAGDTALTALDYETLALGDDLDVVVVNSGSGTPEKVPSTLSAVAASTASVTVAPKAGDLYAFTVHGAAAGIAELTPSVGGSTGTVAQILVTNLPVDASTTLEITPDPIRLEIGDTMTPTYVLHFGSYTAFDQIIPGAALNLSLDDPSVASFSAADPEAVEGVAMGTTTLNAALRADAAVAAGAEVDVSPATSGGAQLLLRETTATGGFLSVTNGADTATYEIWLDTNNNGTIDPGDTQVPYASAVCTPDNGRVAQAAGTAAHEVTVTAVSGGVSGLTVAYTTGGTTYRAHVDLLVADNGAGGRLELSPAYSVMSGGETRVFTVKAVYANEAYDIPNSMFTMTTTGADLEISAANQRSVRAYPPNGMGSHQTRVNDLTATALIGTDTVNVLVLYNNAALNVTPSRMWLQSGGAAGAVTVSLDNPGLFTGDLRPYLTAASASATTANLTEGAAANTYTVTGSRVGATNLVFTLLGTSNSKQVKVYVVGANGIAFDPDTLNLPSGGSGSAQLRLKDDNGNLGAVIDPADGIVFDETAFPSATASKSVAGTQIQVTGANVVTAATGTLTAVTPLLAGGVAGATADLAVTVTGAGSSLGAIEARPGVVELWPGETVNVAVYDTATNQALSMAQLHALTQRWASSGSAASASNEYGFAAVAGRDYLALTQKAGAAAGLETLTLALGGGNTTSVTIVNHTHDPHDTGYTRALVAAVDPVLLQKAASAADATKDVGVEVSLELRDITGAVIDTIPMIPSLVSGRYNTVPSYSGRVGAGDLSAVLAASPDADLALRGLNSGAAGYEVRYLPDNTVSGLATALVTDQDPTTIVGFDLKPDLTLAVGEYGVLEGEIQFGTIAGGVPTVTARQTIPGADLYAAAPDLASDDTGVASVNRMGVVRGVSNGTAHATGTFQGHMGSAGITVAPPNTTVYSLAADKPFYMTDVSAAGVLGTSRAHIYLDSSDSSGVTTRTELTAAQLTADYTITAMDTGILTADVQANAGGNLRLQPATAASEGLTTVTIASQADPTLTITVTVLVRNLASYSYDLWVRPVVFTVGSTAYLTDGDPSNDGKNSMQPTAELRVTDLATSAVTYINVPSMWLDIKFEGYSGDTFTDAAGNDISATADRPTWDAFTGTVIGGDTVGYLNNTYIRLGSLSPANHNQGRRTIVYGNDAIDVTVRPVDPYNGAALLTDGDALMGGKKNTIPFVDDHHGSTGWNRPMMRVLTGLDGADAGSGAYHAVIWVDYWSFLVQDEELTPGSSGVEVCFLPLTAHYLNQTTLPDGSSQYYLSNNVGEYSNFHTDQILTYTVLILENGSMETVRMPKRDWTITSMTMTPHEVSILKGDTRKLEELGAFSSTVEIINESGAPDTIYPPLSDFFIASVDDPGKVNGFASGDWATTPIHGAAEGSTSLWLEYANAANGADFRQEIVVYVRAAAPVGIVYEDDMGNLLTSLSVADGQTLTVTPKYQISDDATALHNIPYSDYQDTANFTMTTAGNITVTAINDGGVLKLRVTGIGSGSGSIYIRKMTHYTAPGPALDVEATGMLGVDVTGTANSFDITGRVTDAATGAVIAGATVTSSNGGTATTNAAGEYTFTSVPNGSYTISAAASGYTGGSVTVTVAGGNTIANVALTPTGATPPVGTYTVSGQVTDAATHAAIPGAAVTLGGQSATTDVGGHYAFTGVSDGTYTLTASAAGYTTGTMSVTVNGAGTTADMALVSTGTALYTVTYNANGGTGTMTDPNSPYAAGATVTVLNNTFSRSNYTFTGWNTAANGSGTAYANEATFAISGSVILYAQWSYSGGSGGGGGGGGGSSGGSSTKYTLTFETNGGSKIDSVTKASGTTIQLGTYVPQRAGYSLLGWYTDKELKNKVTQVTLTKDMTVYAGWEAVIEVNRADHFAYMVGNDEGLFDPDGNITRASTAMMLYRLLTDTSTAKRTFSDIEEGAWYAEAVQVLAGKGIIKGYVDGTFKPDQAITRSEFTAMIARFSEVSGGDKTFSDVPVENWAYMYITSAAAKGWITGYTDGTFRPLNPISRAEAAVITNRMLERVADEDYIDASEDVKAFPDLAKTYWAYYDVIEATNAHDFTKESGAEKWTALREK